MNQIVQYSGVVIIGLASFLGGRQSISKQECPPLECKLGLSVEYEGNMYSGRGLTNFLQTYPERLSLPQKIELNRQFVAQYKAYLTGLSDIHNYVQITRNFLVEANKEDLSANQQKTLDDQVNEAGKILVGPHNINSR